MSTSSTVAAASSSVPASTVAALYRPQGHPESVPQPEPELEPPEPEHHAAAGIASLFAGFPSSLVADPQMGGSRGVVASRDIAAGERVLASAPLGVSVDWRAASHY